MTNQRASKPNEIVDAVAPEYYDPEPDRTPVNGPARRPATRDHIAKRDPGMFYWESSDGVSIVIPRMDSFLGGLIRKHRRRDDADFLFSILEEVLGDKGMGPIDSLPMVEVNQLFKDWMRETGANAGE